MRVFIMWSKVIIIWTVDKIAKKKILAEDRATELNVNADFLENLVGLDILKNLS